jgi:hypothetical protein
MAITRTPFVDDSGTGTDGTIINNALKTELYDQIDAADAAAAAAVRTVATGGTGAATLAAHGLVVGNGTGAVAVTGAGTAGQVMTSNGAAADPTFQAPPAVAPGGRLTLTSGTPVTTADVTGATTVYYCPYVDNRIELYISSAWTLRTFSELSLALGTVTAGLPYDVFAYDNAGTVTLEKLAWTNATTRATALARQDGRLVKSGDATRRYLGVFYTTSTTTTEDSAVKRYLSNYYCQRLRPMKRLESAATWTATAGWRQANANTANQLAWVTGVDEMAISVMATTVGANPSANVLIGGAIGIDSITSPGSSQSATFYTQVANVYIGNTCTIAGFFGIGAHYAAWLDYSGSGTTTYNGTGVNAGISAEVWG